MKLLTKHSDYAIRALLELACKEECLSARDIAKNQGIPYAFLRRILRELIQNKVICGKAGCRGGVKLNVDSEKIRVIDIIRIFQGDLKISDCIFRKKICPNVKKCVLKREITRIENIITNEFAKITIAKLKKARRSQGGRI